MMWSLVGIGIALVGVRKIIENQKSREVETPLGFNVCDVYAKSLLTTKLFDQLSGFYQKL
jgi:hypothetical protein